jgi:predicted RNA binding protein YcfA (HicA-like mRNA interferase family)
LTKVHNQKSLKKLLRKNGWTETQGGKHVVKMEKPGEPRPMTLPHHRGQDYSTSMTASILRDTGLKDEEKR